MFSLRLTISIFSLLFSFSSVIGSKPSIGTSVTPVSCYNADDGKLVIQVKNIDTPCTLNIIKQTSGDTLYEIVDKDFELKLDHLSGGLIDINLFSDSKKITATQIEIPEPEPLLAGKIHIDKAPSDESTCNGTLSVNPRGGTPPYSYKWSENAGSSAESGITGVCMGIYRCEINDSNECGPVYISVPLLKNVITKTE